MSSSRRLFSPRGAVIAWAYHQAAGRIKLQTLHPTFVGGFSLVPSRNVLGRWPGDTAGSVEITMWNHAITQQCWVSKVDESPRITSQATMRRLLDWYRQSCKHPSLPELTEIFDSMFEPGSNAQSDEKTFQLLYSFKYPVICWQWVPGLSHLHFRIFTFPLFRGVQIIAIDVTSSTAPTAIRQPRSKGSRCPPWGDGFGKKDDWTTLLALFFFNFDSTWQYSRNSAEQKWTNHIFSTPAGDGFTLSSNPNFQVGFWPSVWMSIFRRC